SFPFLRRRQCRSAVRAGPPAPPRLRRSRGRHPVPHRARRPDRRDRDESAQAPRRTSPARLATPLKPDCRNDLSTLEVSPRVPKEQGDARTTACSPSPRTSPTPPIRAREPVVLIAQAIKFGVFIECY